MTILKVVLVLLVLGLLWYLRDVFAILLAAVLLAALIEPIADWFHKHHIPRGIAVLFVYVILGLISTIVVVLMIPVVIAQFSAVIGNIAGIYGAVIESVGQLSALSAEYGLEENFRRTLEGLQNGVTDSIAGIFSTAVGFIGSLAALFIILVLAFYLIVEEDRARKYFKNLAPEEYQPFIAQMLHKIQKRIGAWMRGQLILGLIIGVITYIGLRIIGVEYALLLALIAGLLEIIPYFGPIVALIPAAIVGFSASPLQGFLILIFYILLQQLENTVLVPKIMQKVTGLNPIITIISLLIGLKLGGIVGAILAIPVAILFATVLEELFAERA